MGELVHEEDVAVEPAVAVERHAPLPVSRQRHALGDHELEQVVAHLVSRRELAALDRAEPRRNCRSASSRCCWAAGVTDARRSSNSRMPSALAASGSARHRNARSSAKSWASAVGQLRGRVRGRRRSGRRHAILGKSGSLVAAGKQERIPGSEAARRQHVVAGRRGRKAERAPRVAREAPCHQHREDGRRGAPIEERVHAPEHALRAGALGERARMKVERTALARTVAACAPAMVHATRLAETSKRAPPTALSASRRDVESASADPPDATTSQDAGPSQSAVRLSLRAVAFGVVGSARANTSSRGRETPAGPRRPARSRPRQWSSRPTSRRSPRRRSGPASPRRSRRGSGQPREPLAFGVEEAGRADLHADPAFASGDTAHSVSPCRARPFGDERQRDPRVEARAPAPRRHVSQDGIRAARDRDRRRSSRRAAAARCRAWRARPVASGPDRGQRGTRQELPADEILRGC